MNCQDIWETLLEGTEILQRRPRFDFDPDLYRNVYSDMRHVADVAAHYDNFGRAEGRVGTLYEMVVREAPEIDARLRTLVRAPDLARAFAEDLPQAAALAFELIALGAPVDHRVADFSAEHYLAIYSDLAASQIHPFVHYIKFGMVEGRRSLTQLRSNRARGRMAYRPELPTVLVCTHEMSGTGAPRVALQLAESASETHNVVVGALRSGKLLPRFTEFAIEVVWSEAPADEFPYLADAVLDGIDYAVLNSVECFPFVKFLVARGIPFASYVHEFTEYSLPQYKNLHTALFSDQLFLSSRSVYRSWRWIFSDLGIDFAPQTRIIPQSRFEITPATAEAYTRAREALSEALGIDCRARKIVYGAGEAQWRKGTDIFFMLATQCRRTDPDTLFVWIGDGANHEDFHFGVWLEKHMQEAGVNDPAGNAFYLPAGLYYFDLCNGADLLFLSSRFDPLPNVVFDAAKAGCGVLVFEGGSGFDDPAYLSTGVVRKVPYGDLNAAGEMVIAAPRKRIEGRTAAAPPVDPAPQSAHHDTIRDVDAADVFGVIAGALHEGLAATSAPAEDEDGEYDVSLLFGAGADLALRRRERQKIFRYGRLGIWRSRAAAEATLAASRNFVHRRIRISAFSPLAPARHAPFSIHVHAYYPEALEADLADHIAFREAERVLVTTDSEAKAEEIEGYGRAAGVSLDVRLVDNQGRDILPFIALADDPALMRPDDLWCHVHLKKSLGLALGDMADHWRRFLTRILLGDATTLSSALAVIARPHNGLVGAFDPYIMGWTGSRRLLAGAQRHFEEALPEHPLLFPMGNMFWTRGRIVSAMRGIFGPRYPFPNEPIPQDGTEFHLMERLWPAVAAREGTDSVFLDKPDERRA